MSNIFKHHISISKKTNLINITHEIEQDILSSGIRNGIVVVYCPHTTAGITINENADPDVIGDLIYGFEKAFPTSDNNYKHFEGNSHAHLKSSTVGASQTLILNEGSLILGIWQNIYFCEFDGPRNRSYFVKIISG